MLVFLFYFILFLFFILFFYFGSKIRVRVISWSHCHTSVTSDDMITVMVTSYEVTKKNIEGFRKIMLYNMCKIHGYLE